MLVKSLLRFIVILQFTLCSSLVLADVSQNQNKTAVKENNQSITEVPSDLKCLDTEKKTVIKTGWEDSPPYQYNKMTSDGYKLTGMDVEIVRALSDRVGVEVDYTYVDWAQHQLNLKSGTLDFAASSTFTEERAKFAYFTIPYRFEQDSMFMQKRSSKILSFKNIQEFLAQIRLQNFQLVVQNGFIFADPQINHFIKDPANKDIITFKSTNIECITSLLTGNVDGWMGSRIVGASLIFDKSAEDRLTEVPLNIKAPMHLMFSKKSVPIELVDHFNQEIRNFVRSSEYKNIIKTYLYPVLLLQTLGSDWFYIVGIIGTIAFAISGIAIATKENATLFGTFVFAMLPSVGGGIMRDVILNRSVVGIFLTPSYIYYILIIVLIGFFTIRLLGYYNRNQTGDDILINKFWDHLSVVFDGLGQAAFIVTGVTIVIIARINPIELWGAFFAFLTASSGTILRDILRKDRVISAISTGINAEISVVWGLIFSASLNYISDNPDPVTIRYLVIIVVSGAFISRLLVYYLKIPNPTLHNEVYTQ